MFHQQTHRKVFWMSRNVYTYLVLSLHLCRERVFFVIEFLQLIVVNMIE